MTRVDSLMNRRYVLGLMAACGSAAILAGCGSGENTEPQAPAEAPGTGGPDAIKIPDPAAELPTGATNLHWVESGQFSKAFLPTFFEAYKAKHDNVSVKYDSLPGPDMTRLLQLAFQSGDTPDVFRLLPAVLPSGQAVGQKLVQPLDDIVPDFAAWKESFPAGSFTEGINVFNGKTYTFPMLGRFTWNLQFSRKLLAAVDADPEAEPLSLDGFRDVANKVTKKGGGSYYGLVMGGGAVDRWSVGVRILGGLAGAVGEEFDYQRGTFNYTSDAYRAVIDTFLAMKSDGSIDPAAVSMNTDQARAKLPAGQGAMILNETGVLPFWIDQNKDFDFGVAPLPAADPANPGTIYSGPLHGYWWIGSTSKNTAVIGDMFSYLGSLEGQKTWQKVGGGGIPVSRPEANQVDSLDSRLRASYTYFDDIMRIGPTPEARKPDVSVVLQNQKAVSPDFGTVVQGIYTGQITDPAKALTQLQDRAERSLDDAIAAAKKKGADVSRDDWTFPNWDPSKDYTQSDYEAL